MKNDALKKNHFWILAGVAPFLTLLTIVFILSDVGGAVESEGKNIETQYSAVKGAQPKGTKALADWDVQKKIIDDKRGKLWEFNWTQQEKLFTWPQSPVLETLAKKYPKFGQPMSTSNDEFNEFKKKDVYEGAYDHLAASIAPTTFPGQNWRNVLRYVSDWGEKYPNDKQIWLALEDFWVQKGLVLPVKVINNEAAKFELVKDRGAEPADLKRTFRSRVWDLELEVPKEGPNANKVIAAKLRNRTERLQLLGQGNTMRLKITLSEGGQPIDYRIQGEYVKGNAEIEVKAANAIPQLHGIPPGTDVQKIVKVEQVLDSITVPVRRVDQLVLGYKDARHSLATLKAPSFFPAADAAAAGSSGGFGAPPGGMGPMGPGGFGGDSLGPMGPGGPPGGGGGSFAPPGAMGGAGAGGAAAGPGARSGPPDVVLEKNKERYLDVTGQVRRMPFAVVLLVDQLFVQDAIVAYANSPLRCQVTQSHWKRFRGSLSSLSGTDSGAGAGYGGAAPGGSEGEGYSLPGAGRGSPPGGGAGSFAPPGAMPPGGGAGSFAPGMGAGMPGGMGSFGSTPSSGIAEGQATSGLVELSIYGIVTLYEKYEDKPAEGATDGAATGGTTSSVPMTPMTPAPGATGTTTPMTPTAPMTPMAPAAPTTPAPGAPMTPGATPPTTPAPMAPANPATPPAAGTTPMTPPAAPAAPATTPAAPAKPMTPPAPGTTPAVPAAPAKP